MEPGTDQGIPSLGTPFATGISKLLTPWRETQGPLEVRAPYDAKKPAQGGHGLGAIARRYGGTLWSGGAGVA